MITYLLLLVPTALHLWVDTTIKPTEINHARGAIMVTMAAFICSIVNVFVADVAYWQFVIYSLAVHLSLFDPLYNLFKKHKWNYHGDPLNPKRAFTDKLWAYVMPEAEILFRIIFLIVGWSFYYRLDWIIA